MSMSPSYGEPEPVEAEAALRRALEVGITFFDTADVYGNGHNERFVGPVLGSHRDQVVLATKFGITGAGPTVDGRPERVAPCCDASLQRLGVEVIDLYYLHRADPEVPIEDTAGAMAELVTAGKVRTLGLSEVSSDTLRRAHAIHPVAAVQSEYSLWTRDVEKRLLATCEELGVSLVPFSPLGRGFLTATVTAGELGVGDMRTAFPRFQGDNLTANQRLLDGLAGLAADLGATPGQVALAWLLSRGARIVPIPGTKRAARVEENAAAADVRLTATQVADLDTLFDPANIAGERYPEGMLAMVQRD